MSEKQAWRTPFPAARAAQARWGARSVDDRVRVLQRAADFIAGHLDDLADAIHAENGKPRVEAIGHELLPAVAYVRWLGDEAPEILAPEPRRVKWLPHRKCVVERRPFGAVLVISPWNIPFLIPFSQVLGALAAGNAVVLKPSEVTPICGTWIARALDACDLPEGLFTLQMGDGALGAKLIEARPDKVLFTGSVATGSKVMAACAKQSIPVELEQGGIDAAIVCADADLGYAASAVAWGATFNHGQVCASVERLLVEESVFDEFIERVADQMEQINPYEDLSRVTFSGQSAVLERHRDDARERGLTVHHGGDWLEEGKFAPTLYTGAAIADALVWKEETFGPMLGARSFTDDDHAVELHNATRFGLTASVFSGDLDRAGRIARRLNAGNVSINDLGALHYSQPELPWGGVGESGFGRSHGPEGLLGLTWPQVIDASRLGAAEVRRPWWYPYDHRLTDALAGFTQVIAAKTIGERARTVGRTAARLTSASSPTTGGIDMSRLDDFTPRRHQKKGVESWFLRAVHPSEPRALWLKVTTLGSEDGTHVAEAWCSLFDGDRTFGVKSTVPLAQASFGGDPLVVDIAGCRFDFDPEGGALRGALSDERGDVSWDLTIRRLPGPLGDPLCMLPSRRLLDAPLPKNKFVTPAPALRFDGTVTWDGEEFAVESWWGSFGHNWGAAHPPEYGWAQCLFPGRDAEPHCYMEGVTGRINLGGWSTPRMSLLTVRRGDREYRFDRLIDLWNQRPTLDFPSWSLQVSGPAGSASVMVEAAPERMVCLGYYNPDGSLSHCLNSKTAAVTLRVNPVNEDGFECVSRAGGALEFLQPEPEPLVQPVV